MTTELEEQFFKVFGVEQKTNGCEEYFYMPDAESCKECEDKPCLKHLEYPKITDRVLLELICCLIKYEETFDSQFENIKEFKNYILAKCISIKTTGDKWLAKQIQQLFEEGE